MEWSAATRLFLDDRARRGCSAATVRWYADVLSLLARAMPFDGVSLDALRGEVARMQADKLSAVTVRKRVLAWKTFFAWTCSEQNLDNPCEDLVAPRAPKRLPRALNVEQAHALLQVAMSERDKAILSLLLDTGIRLSECCDLDLSDLDLAQGTLLVRMGKGAKQRMVVFESETLNALQEWLVVRGRTSEEALFLSERAKQRLSRQGVYKLVKRIAKLSGIAVSPHKLRHTFATVYLDAGGGIQDLSALMGHTEISTTWIYTKVSVGGLRKKHHAFSPLKALT